jgi:hypothetical protein
MATSRPLGTDTVAFAREAVTKLGAVAFTTLATATKLGDMPQPVYTPLGVRLLYTPHWPHPPQEAFLWLDCLDAFYGGSAGPGKSWSSARSRPPIR